VGRAPKRRPSPARAVSFPLAHEPATLEPALELRRGSAPERLAQRRRVVEGRRAVAEQHVVAHRHAHEVVGAGGGQQQRLVLEVVVVAAHVVRGAGVDAHRQPEQLAHEVVLEAGALDLRGVVQVLGPDEADDRVHEEGRVAAREPVAAGLERDLVDALMAARGQLAALAGLEVQDVGPGDVAALARHRGRLVEKRGVDAEGPAGRLRPGQALEHQPHRDRLRARREHAHLRRDVRQHAGLRGDLVLAHERVERQQQPAHDLLVVARRVDADDRVAAAEGEALGGLREDLVDVVGGMVGLQPHAEATGQAHGRVRPGHDRDARGRRDEVEIAAELGHGRRHLGRQPRAEAGGAELGGVCAQHVVAQLAHGQPAVSAEDLLVEALLDDARDLVALGRQRRALAQLGERHLREEPPRGHALLRRSRREPGQPVARALAVGLGQQLVEVAKTEAAAVDAQRESHRPRILRAGLSARKEARSLPLTESAGSPAPRRSARPGRRSDRRRSGPRRPGAPSPSRRG
jgi:hypothetical protein